MPHTVKEPTDNQHQRDVTQQQTAGPEMTRVARESGAGPATDGGTCTRPLEALTGPHWLRLRGPCAVVPVAGPSARGADTASG